ncbi:MAG: tyrosine-protein phosphatase, partial [Opitutales bacterium]|nr:tyrosine-protein phosphatase [Opitutales bacterium]
MKKSILSLAIFLAAQFALAAITILTPRDGAVVSAIPESLREYLAFDAQKRASIMLDAEYRKAIAKTARHPAAIYFRWNADSGENFVLELSETKNFDAPIAVPAGKSSKTPKQFRSRVYNLKIAQNYFWRIKNTDTGEVTKTRMITVSDASPRIMNISGVLNVRDLGGRVGLDNRRVKQNLIFRGRGLNNNSKDGKTAGKNMITADGIKYMTGVLKIKTD